MSDINIIFYSRACQTCSQLLNLLQHEGILSCFKLFCVDNRVEELRGKIRVVPTMIIKGNNKMLEAGEIFEWVKTVKQLKTPSDGTNPPLKVIGWVSEEMGGVSDGFAYVDVDKAQPKSFFGVGDEERNAIFTAPDIGKMNKKDQSNMMKQLEENRKVQDKVFEDNSKQQINRLISQSK